MSLYRPRTARARRLSYAMLTLAVAFMTASPAPAIEIGFTYRKVDSPSFDPTGIKLVRIARAAADIWESYIHDDQEISWEISWEDLEGNRLGEHRPGGPLGGVAHLVLSTHHDNALAPWFFDETPFSSEEFLPLSQTLVRDLTPQDADEAYSGGPPLLLEAGFSASNLFGSPAQGHFDALTIMLHEMGHALGMNWNPFDDDYDIDSADIGGLSVGAEEADGYELVLETALMNDRAAVKGKRTLPSATDILATHDEGDFTSFNLPRVEYLGGVSDDWDNTLNWIGGAVPSGDEEVFVRDGGSVRLASTGSFAGSLRVEEGSSLATATNNKLIVGDLLQIGNLFEGTSGEVHVGTLTGSSRLDAQTLDIHKGVLNLAGPGSILVVHGDAFVRPGATMMGAGFMEIQGTLVNNGEISAGAFLLLGFGGELSLRAINNGRLDLDGDGGGGPVAHPIAGFPSPSPPQREFGVISAINGDLRVVSPLADAFNGTAAVGAGRTMTFMQPWIHYGELKLQGGGTDANAATLAGAEVTLGGHTTVEGVASITAPLVTDYYTKITVRSASRLNLLTSQLGSDPHSGDLNGIVSLERSAVLNVDLSGDSWGQSGALLMGPGAKVTGDKLFNWGRIEGHGELAVPHLSNGGYIAPLGELRATTATYDQSSQGRLEIDVAGFTQGVSYDILRTGAATLDGAVQISFADDFLPAAGMVFDILTAPQITGAFSTLDLVKPEGVELEGHLEYLADRVSFRVTHSAFEADFDSDGDVDSADLLAWQDSPQPDGNYFLRWQQQVGRSLATLPSLAGDIASPATPTRNPAAVPEPSTAVIALGLMALAVAITRRR
jgi:hypothetical protein